MDKDIFEIIVDLEASRIISEIDRLNRYISKKIDLTIKQQDCPIRLYHEFAKALEWDTRSNKCPICGEEIV